MAAEEVLPRLAALTLSESTVQRATEAVGRQVEGLVTAGRTFGADRPWAWHKDAEGQTCAYVSIDATGVPQQGPDGAADDARMATVAMVYNPVPEDPRRWAKPSGRRPPWQARYLASLQGQARLGEPLRRQAAQVGMDSARRWIGLSDGGSGLEGWLGANFGRLDAVILDFYHASEYLRELAKAVHGAGTEAAQACHREWSHRLKHEGGRVMLDELHGLAPPRSGSAREVWEATVTYFENQVHRMDYPAYRAKGWQIGSGPVESACKRVVGSAPQVRRDALGRTGFGWGLPSPRPVPERERTVGRVLGRTPGCGLTISTYSKECRDVIDAPAGLGEPGARMLRARLQPRIPRISRSAHLSIGVGADDLAALAGPDGPPDEQVDRVLHETDGAVAEDDVHAAGVPAAERVGRRKLGRRHAAGGVNLERVDAVACGVLHVGERAVRGQIGGGADGVAPPGEAAEVGALCP